MHKLEQSWLLLSAPPQLTLELDPAMFLHEGSLTKQGVPVIAW
jgi:hypothetical protein